MFHWKCELWCQIVNHIAISVRNNCNRIFWPYRAALRQHFACVLCLMNKSNSDFFFTWWKQKNSHSVLKGARSGWLAQGKLRLLVPVNGIMGSVWLFGVCSLVQLQWHTAPLSNHRNDSWTTTQDPNWATSLFLMGYHMMAQRAFT